MNKEVVCLYPDFGSLEPLQGLYLRRKCFADVNTDRPFVYANFLSSLDFPWHESLDASGQSVHIVTGAKSKSSVKETWMEQGHDVKTFGSETNVDVGMLMEFLQKQGYRSVYLVAGPQLLQDLLVHNYLDRFFMTMCHKFLGGEDFKSVIPKNVLGKKGHMVLRSLYMDQENSSMLGQWYAEFSHND